MPVRRLILSRFHSLSKKFSSHGDKEAKMERRINRTRTKFRVVGDEVRAEVSSTTDRPRPHNQYKEGGRKKGS